MRARAKKFKIALLCGGPSLERGISLNSARSVLDHLGGEDIEITPFYFDQKKRVYKISKAQLYSNTPSDFDFKLHSSAIFLSKLNFLKELRKCDIAFPVMHGLFGEEGKIQEILEKNNIPFVASSSRACRLAFNKFYANKFLQKKGFYILPSILLKKGDNSNKKQITDFFHKHNISRAIMKPAHGGSSIGVFSVNTVQKAYAQTNFIFNRGIDRQVVVEPFAKGREFTVIVFQNMKNEPVALIPTEIETSYKNDQIFDFRKKYLPTHGTFYHQPPRFSNVQIRAIQNQAEKIFNHLKMSDFARLDGWLLDDRNIWFSDINPLSGLEQNSLYFQQGARIGFSHQDLLRYVTRNACRRHGLIFPKNNFFNKKKKPVHILLGGGNSERQVSLMSGTNVWLKLRKSKIYQPKPYLLDFRNNVWELPYALILNHTVEEILLMTKSAKKIIKKLKLLEKRIHTRLGVSKKDFYEPFFLPRRYSLQRFIKKSPFIFLGLHGSPGEDGTIQAMLEKANVKYNGSPPDVSKLCMNKFATGQVVRRLNILGVQTAFQKVLHVSKIKNTKETWQKLVHDLGTSSLIVKPLSDGCSSGIMRLFDYKDLAKYIFFVKKEIDCIPAGSFQNQKEIVEMPSKKIHELLFENFIKTDVVEIRGTKLRHIHKTGWLEITCGVIGNMKNKKLHVLNPSITISEGEVLSVEEKFQGGTGVNITPPPENIVSKKILQKTKGLIGRVAKGLNISGYARIDAFMNIKTSEISIIEVNTLPGLTPSTVLYQQALAEPKPIYPRQFLEMIIANKNY
ncbi:hypothetical protein A3I25_00645 [Candidatus Nomurabacteria bacterium RIFCSPLOWO2_02_FULL_42_17]|uniref:ATP-grasp domain-containing protein n=1 Tax=Candidatus Nomurabacteria bacterium RIFCSPLOWO2_02_FULL_42_17 TaxID=1801789 RepID=A0A1F6XPR2_9BACT|nr:MAG: hypothetical protein A3I25_00645 [Candidatus Nomurabacteria bacterium RIFCSPLOWO2_02_FULL_42_17]